MIRSLIKSSQSLQEKYQKGNMAPPSAWWAQDDLIDDNDNGLYDSQTDPLVDVIMIIRMTVLFFPTSSMLRKIVTIFHLMANLMRNTHCTCLRGSVGFWKVLQWTLTNCALTKLQRSSSYSRLMSTDDVHMWQCFSGGSPPSHCEGILMKCETSCYLLIVRRLQLMLPCRNCMFENTHWWF